MICFTIVGVLALIGGGGALASHYLLRPVASDAELGGLSVGVLITSLIYCFLAVLCLSSAWCLSHRTLGAGVLSAVTVSLISLATVWNLYRDIQTGVSIVGMIEFVVMVILLAVIAFHLTHRKPETKA